MEDAPDIKQLITEKRQLIDELKGLVSADIPESGDDGAYCKYDDLFFLRYILSYKTAVDAKDAVLAHMTYRALPATKALCQKILETKGDLSGEPLWKKTEKYLCEGRLPSEVSFGPTVLLRGQFMDLDVIFSEISNEEFLRFQMWRRECLFYECDRLTRAHGKLCKMKMLFDMQEKTFTEMMDRRQATLHNQVSTLSSKYYPQLLEKICAVNAPSWMAWVISFFKTVLPEKTMNKIELVESPEALWASPYGKKTFNLAYVPTFLGGTMADTKVRPSLTGNLIANKKSDWKELYVYYRDKKEVSIETPLAGVTVNYTVVLEANDIKLSCVIVDKKNKKYAHLLRGVEIKAGGQQTGSVTVPFPGSLVFIFDNTYSMMTGKTLRYKLKYDESSLVAKTANAKGPDAPDATET